MEYNMPNYTYITLREQPQLMERSAKWFSSKWGVPTDAYIECMERYINDQTEFGWYLCLCGGQIVGGLGVIQNDFHNRKDLAPNICAVYTEKAHRGNGIAGNLLNKAVADLQSKGIAPVYLVTDHIGFYERYGWEFFCMVDSADGTSRLYVHK